MGNEKRVTSKLYLEIINMNDHGKIGFNSAIQVFERAVSVVVGLVTLGVLTRYLGVHDFGLYATALTYLQLFATLLDFGFTILVVQMLSEPTRNHAHDFGVLMYIRLLSAVSVFVVLDVLIFFLPYPALVQWSVVAGSLGFIAILTSSMFAGIFRTYLQMTPVVVCDLLTRIILLVITIIAAQARWNIVGVFTGITIANVVPAIVLAVMAYRLIPFRLAYDAHIVRETITRLWPITLAMVFNLIYFRADTLILSLTQNPEVVGMYTAPYKILEVLINLPHLFLALILPFFVRSWNTKHVPEFTQWWQVSFDILALVIWPVVIGIFVLARPIMVLIAGASFAPSGALLRILIWSVVWIAFGTLANYMLLAMNEQKRMVKWYGVSMVLALAAYWIAIPLYSYWAAAWITFCVELFIACMSVVVVYRLTKIWLSFRLCMLSLFSACIMGGVVAASNSLGLWVQIGVGILVYGVCIVVFRAYNKHVLALISMGFNQIENVP